jgi:Asp-tRNA(Asn)/Glu-tRNA(Gln) amidotransferase A subunit family amidase
MSDTPWHGDACSLVEEFRARRRSPLEELQATAHAISSSDLNAFSYPRPRTGREAARGADTSLPFGGVPIGVKELDQVQGWPDTEACVVFADRVATHTSIQAQRIRDRGGAVLTGLTTASEFGGVNLTRTELNGITRNPWDDPHTGWIFRWQCMLQWLVVWSLWPPVAMVVAQSAFPAGFTGLVGLKSTFGRIPRGARAQKTATTP